MLRKPLQKVNEVSVVILLCQLVGVCVLATIFDMVSRYKISFAVNAALARAVYSTQVSTRGNSL